MGPSASDYDDICKYKSIPLTKMKMKMSRKWLSLWFGLNVLTGNTIGKNYIPQGEITVGFVLQKLNDIAKLDGNKTIMVERRVGQITDLFIIIYKNPYMKLF